MISALGLTSEFHNAPAMMRLTMPANKKMVGTHFFIETTTDVEFYHSVAQKNNGTFVHLYKDEMIVIIDNWCVITIRNVLV